MAVGDIVELTSCVFGEGQNSLNVMHFRIQSVVGTEPLMTDIVGQMSTSWAAVIKPAVSSDYTYRGMKARRVSPTVTAAVISTNGNGAGSIAGFPLPAQCSAVLSLRSSVAPSRTRGRLYMPPTGVSQADAHGVPIPAYILLMAPIGSYLTSTHNIVVGGNSLVLLPVILHKKPPMAFYAIDSTLIKAAFGTQRRRSEYNRGDTPAV